MNILIKFNYSVAIIFTYCFILTAQAQTKPTLAEERLKGLEKREALEQNSPLKHITFRNIGPTQMNGRVVDVDVNPSDATEFYVAYASGGLWHTVNNGLSFVPIFEKENAFSIGDIAVDWTSKTIWVGTGEVNSSRSSYSGTGVYKSINNGKTWQYLGLPESHHIGEIVLHPTNSNIAWVAVLGHLYSPNKERGVYKTIDGGEHWKLTLSSDENTGAVEMDINPQNPNELYACMWYRTRRAWDFKPTGNTSGIYKSNDGGETWKHITAEGSGFATGATIGRCGIAIAKSNPNIIYAVVDNNAIAPDTSTTKKADTSKLAINDFKNISKEKFLLMANDKLDTFLKKNYFPKKYTAAIVKDMVTENKVAATAVYDWLIADDGFSNAGIYGCEVYRSDNGGISWKKVNTKHIDVFSSYGYYFGKIYVSPTNENKVITFGTSIIASNDGGKTFKAVDKSNTHGDWHSCWINPNKDSHWVTGNDGGVNITYDDGKKWFKVTSIAAGQFYNITTDNATPYNVYGGLQDNGTWMGPSKITNSNDEEEVLENTIPEPDAYEWKQIGGGDGMQVQVDTRDNKTTYSGFQFGYYYRSNNDGSGNTIALHPMHDLGETKLRYNWQTPILLSKHQQDIFYYGANKIFRSLKKGEELTPLTNDITNGKKAGSIPYGTITCIDESPKKFGLLYFGTDDGNIVMSKDGGYTTTLVNKNLPQGLWVSRITASSFKEGRVYVALNGYRFDDFTPYLFISEDYGTTWKQIGTDLPFEPINVIREDAKKEGIIYIGTDNGLYTSFDMGKTCLSLGNNLPRVPIHDIVIQQRENELVIGTHGRSIYITALDSVHKIYDKLQHQLQLKASLQLFDPKKMNDGDIAIDCPPAKASKRKKKMVVIEMPPEIKQ
jgi:photosystem II stability/assembly factor-like uncharacterized protein